MDFEFKEIASCILVEHNLNSMFPVHDDTERIHGRPYVNYSLILVNIIVFVWELIATNFFTDNHAISEIFRGYGAVPKSVLSGDIGAILTSMFMHSGIAHIIGNMIFLFVFGDNIEDRFGRIKYLVIYISWGIVAAFVHSIYAVNSGAGEIPAIGASGAISGVLGAYLVMFPKAKIFTVIVAFFITTIRIPAIAYIPFWFILQIIFALLGQSGGIAYFAHIGGFAAGLGTGYIWKVFSVKNIVLFPPRINDRLVRKRRPSLEDLTHLSPPEVIEGADFYEIIAELRGVQDPSNIQAFYDPVSKNVRITTIGSRKYEVEAKLPSTVINTEIEYIHYINGIVRIRLSKLS